MNEEQVETLRIFIHAAALSLLDKEYLRAERESNRRQPFAPTHKNKKRRVRPQSKGLKTSIGDMIKFKEESE